ncbi:MAG: hypothetical protein M1378_00180 [Bacteroidetes bacterium]|nr:hypothetical protein [Bacteroidota bacterium]
MSYEIVYNKQFVRLDKTGEIIPMICVGSNNCYENRGRNARRTRSWEGDRYFLADSDEGRAAAFSAKAETILRNVERFIQSYKDKVGVDEWYIKEGYTVESVENSFGWHAGIAIGGHTSKTSAKRFRGLYSGGIKHAITIEQLGALHIYLDFHAFSGHKYTVPQPETSVRTEDDFFRAAEEWRKWRSKARVLRDDGTVSDEKPNVWLGFGPSERSVTSNLVYYRHFSGRQARRERRPVQHPFYFVLRNDYGYLVRYKRSGFKCSGVPESGKPFKTERQAEAFRKKLVDREAYRAETWTVKRVDQPKNFYEASNA